MSEMSTIWTESLQLAKSIHSCENSNNWDTLNIVTLIVLQKQLDFTVQYCIHKMQTELQTE